MLSLWCGFILIIVVLLGLDLFVIHRRAHAQSIRAALLASAVWAGLGLAFAVFLYVGYERHWVGLGMTVDAVDGQPNDGRAAVVKYITGYLVEKSLSVDNLFVIAMLLSFFEVPAVHQHRVLFWGVFGAIFLRAVMIAAGVTLIAHFHWVLYLFGIFLLFTAGRMLFATKRQPDPGRNALVLLALRLFRVTPGFHGGRSFMRLPAARSTDAAPAAVAVPKGEDSSRVTPGAGVLMLTPLALALIAIEASDLFFAADSIPAVFAITADPFLVFTSNVFAILGLRSLYFALAGMLARFRYLKVSLAVVLALVGVKMLTARWLQAALGPSVNYLLLAAVLLILAAGAIVSMARARVAASEL